MASALVVVSGIPGSGKTTLARALADELRLPLVSKDVIKEALFDTLGTGNLEWSQRLGRAAHGVMYALLGDFDAAIVESHFWRGVSEDDLCALDRPLIQVYCHCSLDLAVERYKRRVASADRHPGHLPEHQSDEAIASWASSDPQPLQLDAPLIRVDTNQPVNIIEVAAQVRAALAT